MIKYIVAHVKYIKACLGFGVLNYILTTAILSQFVKVPRDVAEPLSFILLGLGIVYGFLIITHPEKKT